MDLSYTWEANIFYVDDVRATLDFYKKVFGFDVQFLHEDGGYAVLETNQKVALSFAQRTFVEQDLVGGDIQSSSLSKMPVPVEICFAVNDIHAACKDAVAKGATLVAAPKKVPWGATCAYLRDNNGFLIELNQPDREPPAA